MHQSAGGDIECTIPPLHPAHVRSALPTSLFLRRQRRGRFGGNIGSGSALKYAVLDIVCRSEQLTLMKGSIILDVDGDVAFCDIS